MPRLLLLLLCALLAFPESTLAAPASAPVADSELTLESTAGIPRPRYKKYRGNSRRKYRRNVFRRMAAKRQTKKTNSTPRRRGVITVEPPVRNQ